MLEQCTFDVASLGGHVGRMCSHCWREAKDQNSVNDHDLGTRRSAWQMQT